MKRNERATREVNVKRVRTTLGGMVTAAALTGAGLLAPPTALADDASVIDEWAAQFGDSADDAREILPEVASDLGVSPQQLAANLLVQADQLGYDVNTEYLDGQIAEDLRPRVAGGDEVAAKRIRGLSRSDTIPEPGVVDPPGHPSEDAEDPYFSPRPSGSGGGGGDRVTMVRAKYKGDFFYYPSYSFGINHGHAGIFRQPGVVVEAANKNLGVRKIDVADRTVPEDKTYYFWVDVAGFTDQEDFLFQEAAADWAGGKVGKSYRPWHETKNKFMTAPFNCSQLVWAAYKKFDVTLDDDGGDYVWPADLVQDSESKAYKKI